MALSRGFLSLLMTFIILYMEFVEASVQRKDGSEQDGVCFVVRTYWGHGDKHGGELRALLQSLQAQDNPKYVYM